MGRCGEWIFRGRDILFGPAPIQSSPVQSRAPRFNCHLQLSVVVGTRARHSSQLILISIDCCGTFHDRNLFGIHLPPVTGSGRFSIPHLAQSSVATTLNTTQATEPPGILLLFRRRIAHSLHGIEYGLSLRRGWSWKHNPSTVESFRVETQY